MICHEAFISKALNNYYANGFNNSKSEISWQLSEHWRILSKSPPDLTTRVSYFVPVTINDKAVDTFFLKIEHSHPDSVGVAANEFRRGLRYEAQIYRDLLNPYGLVHSPQHVDSWLCEQDQSFAFLMTCIEGNQRINHLEPNEGLVKAASWLGAFQRKCEAICLDLGPQAVMFPQLNRDSYCSWFESALSFTEQFAHVEPILSQYLDYIDVLVDTLADSPVSLVHGDFYPSNILINLIGDVFPIDWEAASFGAGLLDLCSLVQFWPKEVVDVCLTAYQQSRWLGALPRSFELTFHAGCIYNLARYNFDSLDITSRHGQRYLREFSDALLKFTQELGAG